MNWETGGANPERVKTDGPEPPPQAVQTLVPTTPFAAQRVVPPGSPRKPTRFPALRAVLRAGTIIAMFSITSAGGCGLVAGGMHGLAFAVALFSVMSVAAMSIATGVAAAHDGHRAARLGWEGASLLTTCVPARGEGQLSVSGCGGSLSGVPKIPEIQRERRRRQVYGTPDPDVSVVVLSRSPMHDVRRWRIRGHPSAGANSDG